MLALKDGRCDEGARERAARVFVQDFCARVSASAHCWAVSRCVQHMCRGRREVSCEGTWSKSWRVLARLRRQRSVLAGFVIVRPLDVILLVAYFKDVSPVGALVV